MILVAFLLRLKIWREGHCSHFDSIRVIYCHDGVSLPRAVQNKTGSTVLDHFYFIDEILLVWVPN